MFAFNISIFDYVYVDMDAENELQKLIKLVVKFYILILNQTEKFLSLFEKDFFYNFFKLMKKKLTSDFNFKGHIHVTQE